MIARVESSEVILAGDVREAKSFWGRLCGLMYKPVLPDGQAILITPCNSIHTFGMRFDIDVLFLDKNGIVVKVIRSLGRGRVVGTVREARSVLEMNGGSIPDDLELTGKKINFS